MSLELFKKCYEVFNDELFSNENEALVCELHFYLEANNENAHNCLGCNLASELIKIRNYLSRVDETYDVEEFFSDYLIKCYLLVARIEDNIFKLLNLPEGYKSKNFLVFRNIRKWANFIKHPNAFTFVHHPEFIYVNQLDVDLSNFNLIIDQEFVNRHYSSSAPNKELWRALQNQKDIAVLFPEPEELTRKFCEAVKKFIEVIRDNAVYREVLMEYSTYENFYTNENDK
ncbi:hypothetical protein [Thiolinea disciformis]|uniref:hypothetical protein n=1 Tax=Thiolinea disciformis TaxID=125614 RepID=UPI00035ECDCC|nr:hypothetical protein [Thiolinea disciformis]